MIVFVNLVLWCILVITKQCLTEEECVQRRLGACRTLVGGDSIRLDEFHSPQPDGFLLKTSMEINLLDNKHTFENKSPVEKIRPVSYNLDNAALVTILIKMNVGYIQISLGKKYYRMAELLYRNWNPDFRVTKYSRYTPILPTFPYNLNLEIKTNGAFAVYADSNTEPFFEYQVAELVDVNFINYHTEDDNNELIAFVDCSVKYKPNCGVHRVEKLYGCREWLVGDYGAIEDFEGFQKPYGKDVIFDEFIVVDIEYSSKMEFRSQNHRFIIEFKVNSIEAVLYTKYFKPIKTVQTEQWFQVPASPYAVRVLLTTGKNNSFLEISNLQDDTIISMHLCGEMGSLLSLTFTSPKLYFDCFTSNDSIIMSERPRKTNETEPDGPQYHENGYNYTKTFIDTSDFASEPFVMYQYDFGNSTQDWCPDEPQPEVLVTSKYDDDSLNGIIERSKTELHLDLQKINAQNNATADTNAALLTELKKVSADTAAVLTELKAISNSNKAILNALATHIQQNTSREGQILIF